MSERTTVTAEEFLARQKDMLVAAINETNQDNDLRGLRDHFAGLAMQGILSNSAIIDNCTKTSIEWVAKNSYAFADAMLEAR